MKKLGVILAVMAIFGLLIGACGDDGDDFDNVAACNNWVAAMECGEYDFSESIDCSIYANTACDIADYFNCLTDNTTCDEETGIPDFTGWGECANLASCA